MSIKINTYWNIFGSVAPLLIGLVTIPILLEALGNEKLGILTLIWALIGYFSIFDFGLGRALTQRIAFLRSSNSNDEISLTSKYGVVLMFIIGLIGSIIFYVLVNYFSLTWLNFSEEVYIDSKVAILLAILAIPLTTLTSGFKGILEGFEDFKTASILRAILGILNFTTPLLSLWLYGPSLKYIVIFLILSRLVIMIFHAYFAQFYLDLFIKSKSSPRKYISDIIYFGFWMTISNIVSPLMVIADRFAISAILGASLVAYYTIPAEFLIRLLIIPAALTTTLFPKFSQLIANDAKAAKSLFQKSIKTIAVIMTPLVLAIAIFSFNGLSLWLGAEFASNAYMILTIMSLGILFNSLAQVPHTFLQANGSVKLTSIIHIFEFFAYMPLLIIFINLYGIIGASIIWTLRTIFDFMVLYYYSNKIIGLSNDK